MIFRTYINMKTKYPIKLGDTLYPTGTEVEIVPPDNSELQTLYPGINYITTPTIVSGKDTKNPKEYSAIAVQFPKHPCVTIIHKDQVIFN